MCVKIAPNISRHFKTSDATDVDTALDTWEQLQNTPTREPPGFLLANANVLIV